MNALAGLTHKQLEYLPDMPDQALAEWNLVRQKVRMYCRAFTCCGLRDTIPSYEGDHMYILSCLNCGDTLEENVNVDQLFVELDSRFIEEA
jgi:hypothetical protein